MSESIIIRGEKVDLKICTKELWHEFDRNYVLDPMMDQGAYVYDFELSEKSYHLRADDKSRLYFAIMHGEKVIGRIYLKHMDNDKMSVDFGIALINDSLKGQGFGTEAVKLLIGYVFNELGFKTITAGSVIRNARSQHILEKIGFIFTHEDSDFKYYKMESKDYLK